jgi:hypothetical protein
MINTYHKEENKLIFKKYKGLMPNTYNVNKSSLIGESNLIDIYHKLIKLKQDELNSIYKNEPPDASITKEQSELHKKEEENIKYLHKKDIIKKTIEDVSQFREYINDYKIEKDTLGLGQDVIEKLYTLEQRCVDYENLLIRKKKLMDNFKNIPEDFETIPEDLETKISDLYKELSELHREFIEVIIKHMLNKKSRLKTELLDLKNKNLNNQSEAYKTYKKLKAELYKLSNIILKKQNVKFEDMIKERNI